jgi:hypothetical protein
LAAADVWSFKSGCKEAGFSAPSQRRPESKYVRRRPPPKDAGAESLPAVPGRFGGRRRRPNAPRCVRRLRANFAKRREARVRRRCVLGGRRPPRRRQRAALTAQAVLPGVWYRAFIAGAFREKRAVLKAVSAYTMSLMSIR